LKHPKMSSVYLVWHLFHLYVSGLAPVLSYAAVAWWLSKIEHGRFYFNNWSLNLLDSETKQMVFQEILLGRTAEAASV
jgi:hypothetical protein